MVSTEVMVQEWAEQPGDRTHFGFLAPDLKQAFARIGMDFGGYVESSGGFIGLRPGEQIPILWKAIQELAGMVAELQQRVGK